MSVSFSVDPITGHATARARHASGSLTAPGASPETFRAPAGDFGFSLEGTFTGSVVLERSANGGASWVALAASPGGAAQAWTAPGFAVLTEPVGALYRARATSMSGAAVWRLSRA